MPQLWSPDKGSVTGFAIFTLTGTRDPLATDDATAGVQVGHVWFNATAGQLRTWACRDNTAGAAKWIFEGADYLNGGTNPAIEVTAFGGGAGLMAEEGNVNRQILGTAVSPGSTGNDNVLAVYSLPAGSFDVSGRGICITAQGNIVNNANAKRVKIIFGATTAVVGSAVTGGTMIADTGSVSGSTTQGGFALQAQVFKYGAAGSNTQLGLHTSAQVGPTTSALIGPTALTATESGAILIAVTGNATTATTDILQNFLEINGMN